MPRTLSHADAEILVEDIDSRKKRVTVTLKNSSVFMPVGVCETTYPLDLIEKILNAKRPPFLCDEILRDESPDYVEKHIRYDVLSYVEENQFRGCRILDFGCGSAASTMVLSRLLPDTRIFGVELESSLLEIAEARAKHYDVGDRVKFFLSPDGNSLPDDIGEFDYIFLNAVYEHLLPQERQIVFPLLWNHLKPNGILFVNQTPYRWFPVENHTTSGLPLINYMPDSIASYVASRFSVRDLANDTWPILLRKGIRGGSVGEIFRILKNSSCPPDLLAPSRLGLSDRIDLWYAVSVKTRHQSLKKLLLYIFKFIKVSTGQIFLPTLSLAIRKRADNQCKK